MSNAIVIDPDAAGYGWSIASSPVRGGVDLLSAVTHELGHVLGFDHGDPFDVMGATLAPGVRRVPASPSPVENLDTQLHSSDFRINRSSIDALFYPSTAQVDLSISDSSGVVSSVFEGLNGDTMVSSLEYTHRSDMVDRAIAGLLSKQSEDDTDEEDQDDPLDFDELLGLEEF